MMSRKMPKSVSCHTTPLSAFSVPDQDQNGAGRRDYTQLVPRQVGTERVVSAVPIPETRPLTTELLFSNDELPNLNILRGHLAREGKLDIPAAIKLVKMGRELIAAEPNVLFLHAEVTIIGDTHGQFYDLLEMLGDLKTWCNRKLLLLGDYVDRGAFSSEIIFLLLALKLHFPQQIFMLRGNHETRMMAEYMTFALECETKYNSEELYQEFLALFDALPLCALLHSAGVGTYMAIREIELIDRFKEPETEGPLCDLLWSDPLEELPVNATPEELRAWRETDFVQNTPRQTSWFYGPAALKSFLKVNNLVGIIRAHQVVEAGFKEHYLEEFDMPPVITLFSCPNYCDVYKNKGAVMTLWDDSYEFEQFVESPHPFYLPDLVDPFSYALPHLMQYMVSVLSDLVVSIKAEKAVGLSPEDAALDASLAAKLANIRHQLQDRAVRQQRLAELKSKLLSTPNSTAFELVRSQDMINEQSPHRRLSIISTSTSMPRTLSLSSLHL
ncbi:calcineurin catalytic subunit A [Pelomyxa schiedti]|nr:calcineurin catalytic subunit A [Pelomyxa schiedti]